MTTPAPPLTEAELYSMSNMRANLWPFGWASRVIAQARRALALESELARLRGPYGPMIEAADREANPFRVQDLTARLEKAETELAQLRARRFPIMGGPSLPWAMIAPHDRQARSNHDQSLERLAERGGLSPLEAVCVLEDRKWRRGEMTEANESAAKARLSELIHAWENSALLDELAQLRREKAEREALERRLRKWITGSYYRSVRHQLPVASLSHYIALEREGVTIADGTGPTYEAALAAALAKVEAK